MKFNFDAKNKKTEIEADVERIVEKGMNQYDKDWKEKFNIKHNAKKEMLEIKHKQNLENKENDLKKKTIIQEIFDGINSNKKIKLEEQRKLEEEKKRIEEERIRREQEEIMRIRQEKEKLGKILLIVGFIITIVGFGVHGLQMIGSVGFIGCITGIIILLNKDNKSPKSDSKK